MAPTAETLESSPPFRAANKYIQMVWQYHIIVKTIFWCVQSTFVTVGMVWYQCNVHFLITHNTYPGTHVLADHGTSLR